jgi:hypothetical protein
MVVDSKAKLYADNSDKESEDEESYNGAGTGGNDVISREEVYYTGKENIEGLACLLNIFLMPMVQRSSNPAIINIDNDENFNEDRIKRG